tara:strand:- start:1122 stop:1292 length:171 start_codon:yes stop_codon:yes gene_type:complete
MPRIPITPRITDESRLKNQRLKAISRLMRNEKPIMVKLSRTKRLKASRNTGIEVSS